MTKFVYSFNEGSRNMQQILGCKGANLAEMTGIGLPVPFGFTITTEGCKRYFEGGGSMSGDLEEAIHEKITELENVTGKVFGSPENPLLVSVRAGAPVPMPGVLDTVLNLGLNDETLNGLAAFTGSRHFALGTYCRFIRSFASVVMDVPESVFDDILKNAGADSFGQLSEKKLEELTEEYKTVVKEVSGRDFPQDLKQQLVEAIKAVFMSFGKTEAAEYRKKNKIPHDAGNAVSVQAMVFGNMDDNSAAGIVFTRNPETGEKCLSGSFLINAQGVDLTKTAPALIPVEEMENLFPDCYKVLQKISDLMEKHYKCVQEMEFAIEKNKLYMLQTRNCRMSAFASVKTAVEMAEEGLIDKETAIIRVEPEHISLLLEKDAVSDNFSTLMEWADEVRELKIRANAETAFQAALAVQYGADGIGLCRTEHMFIEENQLSELRKLILSDSEDEKKAAMEVLRPVQQADFREIYKVMGEHPVTIRLLDPALQDFLPGNGKFAEKEEELRGENPLLGSRGCRLTILTPEIAGMQTEAIIRAALEVNAETENEIVPEIMIPLVSTAAEFAEVKKVVIETADRCIKEAGTTLHYMVGTMIETPRAALTADEIAAEAEFFAVGTNDLTQLTFGFSQTDTGRLIDEYVRKGILEADPFRTLDMSGVGKLIKTACELGKQVKPRLRTGLCGEHGGDPATIEFCHRTGMNYVSCAPSEVPAARLAAARAAVKAKEE